MLLLINYVFTVLATWFKTGFCSVCLSLFCMILLPCFNRKPSTCMSLWLLSVVFLSPHSISFSHSFLNCHSCLLLSSVNFCPSPQSPLLVCLSVRLLFCLSVSLCYPLCGGKKKSEAQKTSYICFVFVHKSGMNMPKRVHKVQIDVLKMCRISET